ncbi:DNA methyltransferase [Aminivibrio sp.]|uniref:DNA methyltransferase n=1 Tax=Aminivibrio sp. TaxID=1872489 RepID=UPI00345C5303
MCDDRNEILSLGYKVEKNGDIEFAGENVLNKSANSSKIGYRHSIISDLGVSATNIAANYLLPFDIPGFEAKARKILKDLKEDLGWMYQTYHIDGKTKCQIEYTVWSELFSCPECGGEIVFTEQAYDEESQMVSKNIICNHCGANAKNKQALDLMFETRIENGVFIEKPKRIPVLIKYKYGKSTFEKKPDQHDADVLKKIEAMPMPDVVPFIPIPEMQMANVGRMKTTKISHIHLLFLPRVLHSMSYIWKAVSLEKNSRIRQQLYYLFEQGIWTSSICNSYRPAGFSQVSQYMKGVYYVPSQHSELSPWYVHEGKLKRLTKVFSSQPRSLGTTVISTASSTSIHCPNDSIDYIFTDPPFGENIYYSDLNFLIEAWLGVFTNPAKEAIIDKVKEKKLSDYQSLMEQCFSEYFRVLKPGRWITIEFSNTKASVWNSIQTAIANAGFIVASVSALDKKQGTFQAVNTPTAVKQDLVISAYKPNGGFEDRFQKEAQTEEGVWDFVRTHLKYLPVTKQQGTLLQFVPERDPRILFDQMVAYYVRKGYPVPISSQEFQIGLSQRFIERDGMFFLPDQVAEYDRKKMTSGELKQMSMFVSDEASAIQWLRQLIKEKPQTFSDINPQFMQQLGGWSKNEAQLDLRELLNQNFLCYDGKGPVPEQIHAYLSTNWKELRNLPKDAPALVTKARDRWYVPDPNKSGDLEKLREKALLKEFEEYKEVKKKLKVFRLEAVRAGFKKAWQERDYVTIISVAEKIPNNVLEEDPKLLMWYDQAVTRLGED